MATFAAFVHHLAAFTLVAALTMELVLIRQELTVASARRLLFADAMLGISAGVLLIAGLLRVVYFEKGAGYYFSSFAFIVKFSVFIALGILSTMPTVEFLSWRKALKAGKLPQVAERRLRMIQATIHGELAGVVVILLCAAIMAKGGWM